MFLRFFFFHHPATSAIYTLSLHDALPIYLVPGRRRGRPLTCAPWIRWPRRRSLGRPSPPSARARKSPRVSKWLAPMRRSEEHTSELQSRENLVCRLLLEKKKKTKHFSISP